MKTAIYFCVAAAAALNAVAADTAKKDATGKGQVMYVYDQKVMAVAPVLVPPEQAQAIVERFGTNYAKLESSRVMIYVNRELVDEDSGVKLVKHTEKVEKAEKPAEGGTNDAGTAPAQNKTVVDNQYNNQTRTAPTLADRQTVRDVERLVGRPLRAAGVTLVDQHVATQMIADRPWSELRDASDSQAAKDREALSKFTDVVLEVLMSSRKVTSVEITGDKEYTVPDLQITAIRLKDARILGQASAADLIGRNRNPGYVARNFTVQDITEATALSLMDDMMQGQH